MNVTMKKTAAAALVALMLSGCSPLRSSSNHTPQPIEPVPTVQAIDYSKQSVQQLEQSATTAQKVLSDSQAKLTQVETQITEINRRITTLNEEIRVLEKAEKTDANALKEKRDALAEANQALTVQNKILVVAQQDVKQAQINVTNVQNILIEKKAEQNKPPVVIVPDNPSQPSQPTQPAQPTEPEQPSQPSQPVQPEQPNQPVQPAQPEQPSNPIQPTEPEQPNMPSQPAQPDQPKQPSQPTQPTPQPEKPEVDLEGKEWRNWNSSGWELFKTKIGKYANGYDGPRGSLVLSEQNAEYFKDLDFYQIAKQDKNNPNFYGWHEGSIENEGIQGIEIKGLEFTNTISGHNITQAIYPEKFNYMFKNTPYATYGALFTNEHDIMIFTTNGSSAVIGEREGHYSVGKYRVNDKGGQTNRVDFIDEVKGSATYKGEVLARTLEYVSNNGTPFEYNSSLPFKDGDITINAHFGTRPEESFTTAILNSKTLGEQHFDKSRMKLFDNSAIEYRNTNNSGVEIEGFFVGENAAEAVGDIRYERGPVHEGNGNFRYSKYNGVFSAEKQPKQE